jgi:hypothetical protein
MDESDESERSDKSDGAERGGQLGIAVWLLGSATLAAHLLTANGYGIFRDEFYYIACSKHLAFGYVDHPPLSILILAAWRALFGDSLVSLRFLPGVAHAAIVILFGMIARELWAGRFGQAFAALSAAIMPVLLGVSSFYSMNPFDALFWAACVYVLCRIFTTQNVRLWLLFGIVAGFGLVNKFSVGFLGLALPVGLLFSQQRKHLLSPYLYAGGAVAFLIFLPHVLWQLQHDWITLEFMHNAAQHKNSPTDPIKYFLDQVLVAHPLLVPVWLAGIVYGLRAEAMRPFRPFAIMFVGLFFFFSLTRGKSYYLAPAYALVVPVGALVLERLTRERFTWMRPVAFVVATLGGLALAPLAVPLLPVERLIAYQSALGIGNIKEEVGHGAPLNQHFADRFGWKEFADDVAKLYRQLPEEERDKCVILCNNYGEAGAIDFYGRNLELPHAISPHNNYWLWGPDGASPDIIIVAGWTGVDIAKKGLFESGGEVARSVHPYSEEHEIPIFVFRNLKPPLSIAQLWADYKKLI